MLGLGCACVYYGVRVIIEPRIENFVLVIDLRLGLIYGNIGMKLQVFELYMLIAIS